jgi:CcmD family protein
VNGYRQVGPGRGSRRPRWTPLARLLTALTLVLGCLLAAPQGAAAAPQQPQRPAARDEFVPVKELPPGDELPAAPFLIAAYAVAWLVIAGYAWSLWRQLGRVERELRALNARLDARGR